MKVIRPTEEAKNLMMNAFANMFTTSNDVLPNPDLADKLVTVIKRNFKDGAVTISLKDPCANLWIVTNGVAIVNTWVRSGNQHVTSDPNDMGPIVNLARSQVLAAGFRKNGEGKARVCRSLAYTGIMAMKFSNVEMPSPPPLILDLVPTQKSGSARINASNTDVAELILEHVLATCNVALIEGCDNINLIQQVHPQVGARLHVCIRCND